MIVTQDMYDVTLQAQRVLHVKIDILNFQFLTVDEISGVVIGDPSIEEDATSDIRRSCNVSLAVKDSTFNVESGGKIWIDKYIKIYVGIENIYNNNEVVWFNKGIYLINQPSYQYDSETNILTFDGVDLMAKLTGLRNGNLEGLVTKVEQGSKIRDVIVSTLKMAGFERYIINVNENEDITQYDIEIEVGSTVYDLLTQIRDTYPNYQIYFDIDGVFHYEPIPSGENEPVTVTQETWDKLYISYTNQNDFERVKNVIEVLGKAHDIAHYGEATNSGSQYSVTINSITTLSDYMMIGVTLHDIIANPTLKINSLTAYPIVNTDGTPAIIPEEDTYYVVQYIDKKYIFMGYQQAYGIIKDENPESPFYVKGTVGEIRIVLSDGDYEIIPSNDLAYQRAKFELYQRARLNDNIDIETVPIYYLEPYDLIEFKTEDDKEPEPYIIQNISTTLGIDGTQQINASRYYPFYPVI